LDNGLGIPKSELEPIFRNSNKEKSLEHGSGFSSSEILTRPKGRGFLLGQP